MLLRSIGTQAQGCQQFNGMQVLCGTFPVTTECNPAHPVATGTVNFRQPVECRTQGIVHQRGHGNVVCVTIEHLLIDFITEDNDLVLLGDPCDLFK